MRAVDAAITSVVVELDSGGGKGSYADMTPPPPVAVEQGLESPSPPRPTAATDVAASKARTQGALLGGLRSGKLEEAVKMEADMAADERAVVVPAPAPPPRPSSAVALMEAEEAAAVAVARTYSAALVDNAITPRGLE
eukprot:SAG11_NODE_814_length_7033_cov_57.557254_3_plen_138_part_00